MVRDEWNELCFPLSPDEDHSSKADNLNSMVCRLQMHAVVEKTGDGSEVLKISYNDAFWKESVGRNAGRKPTVEPTRVTCGEARSMRYALGAKEAASSLHMPLSTFYRKLNGLMYADDDDPFNSF
ncbi:hypothetical protein [Sphaerochaeta sp. PS]|uniref:hypothetical protein n=1 Tax=Sphaerochaeta sp. PS TaxID=3076336 RepID=UPI0028A359FD|nr:hypothetical protein [Sphaerochaeta sp. PS]MDT4763433.1 hypothetical protein [Sphaerochaeta sp. PS]